MSISGQKYTKQTQIKNISKIQVCHEYQVWQFSDIGQGRKYEDKGHPIASVYEQKIPFFDVGNSFGTIHSQSKDEIDIQ